MGTESIVSTLGSPSASGSNTLISMNEPSEQNSWGRYLATTVGTPRNALVFFIPPIAAYFLAKAYLGLTWEENWIQLLFLFWGVWHIADAVLLWLSPVTFGLRLYFPPLEANPTPEALGLVRMVICIDLTFAGVRFGYGLEPTSGVLFVLAALTALIQGVSLSVEAARGLSDSRAASIAWGGAVFLGMGLIAQLRTDGIVF